MNIDKVQHINFWGFSLVILGDVSHGYAAKQNYITVTGVPVVLLITFFFFQNLLRSHVTFIFMYGIVALM